MRDDSANYFCAHEEATEPWDAPAGLSKYKSMWIKGNDLNIYDMWHCGITINNWLHIMIDDCQNIMTCDTT